MNRVYSINDEDEADMVIFGSREFESLCGTRGS